LRFSLLIRWADLSGRSPPVALVLSGVRFRSDEKKNLLQDPVIVAQVLSTPNVDNVIYQTSTNELRINGTGFIGSKSVNFYFKPPLNKKIAYDDISTVKYFPYKLSEKFRTKIGPFRNRNFSEPEFLGTGISRHRNFSEPEFFGIGISRNRNFSASEQGYIELKKHNITQIN